ncbi:MAG TPA: adenylyl-sulfate kinase [Polyangiaceae bacterium]|nr:adenylyl-sulfate kinase [Polyangiaceae bacterium]
MSGVVLWITGKPSAGKSTFARAALRLLQTSKVPACMLDGDEVRAALRPPPGYDAAARDAFYETLGELAALLARQGLCVLVPATASRAAFRERAKQCAPAFLEVFVDVPQDEVEARDSKGLYRAVREGRAQGVPGADAVFETPARPDVTARGGKDEVAIAEAVALATQRCGG